MRVCVYVVMYRPDLYKKEYTHPMALSDPANQREHTTFSTLGISAPAAVARPPRLDALRVRHRRARQHGRGRDGIVRVEHTGSERARAPAPRHRQHRGERAGAQPPPLVADEADDAEIVAGFAGERLAVRRVQQARGAAERGALRGDGVHGNGGHD